MLRAAPRITKESRSHAAFLVSVFMVFLRFVVVKPRYRNGRWLSYTVLE